MRDDIDFSDISTKRLPLRIVCFAVAVAVAIGAFVYGIRKRSGNEAGWTVISARADGDAPLYAADFRLTYKLEGSSGEIRERKNEITGVYSDALIRLYKLLDTKNDYPGFEGNLSDLNKRLNRDVKVPQELFDILRDALERSERDEGYSIYTAPLFAEWESIAYAADAADFDPLRNADEAARLREIAAQCADRDNCRLEIVDAENCVVRLHATEAYLQFLNDYELPRTVLDLNVLKNACILRGAAAALEERDFADGFLYTTDGMTLSLSGHSEGDYVINSYVNKHAQLAAQIPVEPGTACSVFSAFPAVDGEAGYYALDGVLRCAARPVVSGEDAPVRSAFALRRDGDVVQAAWEAYCAFLQGTETGGADLLVCTPTDGDGKTLYASGPETEKLKPEDGVAVTKMTSP